MKSKLLHIMKRQEGTATILVTIAITALLGFTALVTDVGIMYINRHQLINAVDAAALAGIQDLPNDATNAVNTANLYAQENGVDVANLTVTVENNNKITVKVQREAALFFAKLLGHQKKDVSAEATALVASVTSVTGAVPFGIERQEFVYGQLYTLKEGGGDGSNGNYGAIALGGTGSSNYEERLKYGYNEKLTVGSWIPTETGNMSNPTIRGVQYRINECSHCPYCTYDHFVRGCPRYMLIPVIDYFDNGRSDVQIVGFAAFFIESVGGTGNDCYVQGRFVQTITQGDIDINQTDYGLRAIKLIH